MTSKQLVSRHKYVTEHLNVCASVYVVVSDRDDGYPTIYNSSLTTFLSIRASVDALYRDGTGQISRNPVACPGGGSGCSSTPSPWPWHCVMINLMARRLFLA